MIWFTSDFHFGHNREFLYGPRGFRSAEESAEKTIKNYNSLVEPDDTVYILGDCMLNDSSFGIECLHSLKGHKHLIIGNHDTDNKIELFKKEWIFESIQYGERLRYGKFSFWLSHYPMKMGIHKPRHPVWNLSGHQHNEIAIHLEDCIYNVVLNAHDNYPVNIEQIVEDIQDAYSKLLKARSCETCIYNIDTETALQMQAEHGYSDQEMYNMVGCSIKIDHHGKYTCPSWAEE